MTNHPQRIRLVAIDPPFAESHGVLFGLQSGKAVKAPVSASKTTAFDLEIQIVCEGSEIDFKGGQVQGRKGDRFVYLSWGLPGQDQQFTMFARAKIKLAGIPEDIRERAVKSGELLVCELQATNHKGEPASGTIKPPAVVWRVGDKPL